MGDNMTGEQRIATSRQIPDRTMLSRLRRHYRGSTALSNRALFWGAPLVGAALLSAVPAAANPTGGSVVGGSATITGEGTGKVTINQTTDRAILHWDDFSIGAGETTQFVQPGSGSIAVNRVTGTAQSLLLGTLTANGNVWIINPNGLAAGAGAVIDVNGFLASTADILDSDILDGDNRFSFDIPSTNPDASIVNLGEISVGERGLAALVAPGVENDGLIVGHMAQVVLGGAETFALDFAGDGLLSFEVTSAVASAPDGMTDLVTNSGRIEAPGGTVLLTAESMEGVVDNVINMSGVIQAQSLTTANGTVVLSGGDHGMVRVSGTIDASGTDAGETGGTVKLLGETVALELDALIDASGDVGGGTVLAGGNYLGQGPEQNASQSFVGADVEIRADALTAGDGGTVVVWADDYTRFYGTITARGGADSGDGGFVEVSGKQDLHFTGVVDAGASAGVAGTLLLDPLNVQIIDSEDGTLSGDVFTASTGDVGIAPLAIETALSGGTDVTINTGTDGAEDGNITVVDDISIASGTATLTLNAANDIIVNDVIQATDTAQLSVELNANTTAGGVNGDPDPTAGDVDINAAITTNGGTFSSSGVAFDNTGGDIDTGGGTLSLDHSGTVTLGASLDAGTGDILFENALGISQTGGTITGDELLVMSAGLVELLQTGNDVNTLAASVTGGTTRLWFEDADGVDIGSVTGAGGAVEGITVDGTTAAEVLIRAGGDITFDNQIDAGDNGFVSLVATGNIVDNFSPVVGDVVARNLTIDAAGVGTGTDVDDALVVDVDNLAAKVDGEFEIVTVGGTGGTSTLTITSLNQLGPGTGTQISGISAGGEVVIGRATTPTVTSRSITVAADVTTTGANQIIFDTPGAIEVNATMSTASGIVVLEADSGITQDAVTGAIAASDLLVLSDGAVSLTGSNQIGTLAADVTGTGNGFVLTDLGGLEVGSVTPSAGGSAVDGVTTADGSVSLTTDGGTLTVAQAVTAGGDGSDVSLTTTDSGAVAVNAAVTATGDQVEIATVGGATGTGAITASELLILSNGAVSLTGSNQIGTLAADLTGAAATDGIEFAEADGFTVGSVSTTDGVTTNGGAIDLTTAAGSLSVAQAVNATTGGAVTLDVAGGATGTGAITASELLILSDGAVSLTGSNQIRTLAANVTGTGNGFVLTDLDGLEVGSVTPSAGGSAVDGVTTADGSVSLTTDGGTLTVAQAVTAGGYGSDVSLTTTDSGAVAVNAAVTATGDQVEIATVGGATGTGAITASELLILSNGAVSLTGSNQIGTLAADLTKAAATDGIAFQETSTDGFVVGSVSTTDGVTTNGGAIDLTTAAGSLSVAQAVNATTGGAVTLDVAGGATGTGAITASELLILSNGAVSLTGSNQIGTLAADLTKAAATDGIAFQETSTDGFVVGSVSTTNGVSTNGGDIELTATAGSLGVAQDVNATADGGVALDVDGGATGTGAITADVLRILSNGAVSLTGSNQIGTLAADLTGAAATDGIAFQETSTDGFVVGSVSTDVVSTIDGISTIVGVSTINGVSTNGGDIELTATAGSLDVAQEVDSGGGDVSLNGSDVTFAATGDVNAGDGDIAVDGGAGTISTAFDTVNSDGTLLLSTGTVELIADEIDLADGSQVGGSDVAIGQATTVIVRASTTSGTDRVDIEVGAFSTGDSDPDNLNLDTTDLRQISATNMRIGDPGDSSVVRVGAWDLGTTSPSTTGTLTLASAGGISQFGALDLSNGADLIVRAGGSVSLDNPNNNFGNIAVELAAGSLDIVNSDRLTITNLDDDLSTAPDDVVGITAPGGVTLTANTGGVAVNSDIDGGTGAVVIAANGDAQITNDAAIGTTGNVTLIANEMDLLTGSSVTGVVVTLQPESVPGDDDAILVGTAGDTEPDTLELSIDELETIGAPAGTPAPELIIGSSGAGDITVTASIDQTNIPGALTLISGGNIEQDAGTALTVNDLRVEGLSVTLNNNGNNVETLSGSVTSLSFTDGAVGLTVDGLTATDSVTLIADDLDVSSAGLSAGSTVTILALTKDSTIGVGNGSSGDMVIDGVDLGNIEATTLRIGDTSDARFNIAGTPTRSIEVGTLSISPDDIGTLELRTDGALVFDGTVDGGFNLSTFARGTTTFNRNVAGVGQSSRLGTVIFQGAGDVVLNNNRLAAVRLESGVDRHIRNDNLELFDPNSFQGIDVDTLHIFGDGSAFLFGAVNGDNTENAAIAGFATTDDQRNDRVLNGCVIQGGGQCFELPPLLPVGTLDLSLDEERLLREPLEEEEEEFEDLLSNTGNEELW